MYVREVGLAILAMRSGAQAVNIITYNPSINEFQLSKLKVRGDTKSSARIFSNFGAYLQIKDNLESLCILLEINKELDGDDVLIDQTRDEISDHKLFKSKFSELCSLFVTLGGLLVVNEVNTLTQTKKKLAEQCIKLFPTEFVSSCSASYDSQYIMVTTHDQSYSLSRFVLLEFYREKRKIKELRHISFRDANLSAFNGSLVKAACFDLNYSGFSMFIGFEYDGNNKVYSYYIKDAKMKEIRKDLKLDSGVIECYSKLGDEIYIIKDTGVLYRISLEKY